jgi:riboflavin synthase
MFSGIVVEIGRLRSASALSAHGGVRLEIGHSLALGERLRIGDSLAVDGVCLTAIALTPISTTVEVSPETMRRTTFGEGGKLAAGCAVNLEPALRVGEPLGGHWVQGHVDGLVRVVARRDLGEHRELAFDMPSAGRSQIVEKGSVTLDGVSLTVAALTASTFTVALIPHTLANTTLGGLSPGDAVNFEADILAKYIAQALQTRGLLPAVEPG